MSSIDLVGFLPAPSKAHAGAADILEHSALAYGVATSVCVYEVHRLHAVCTLQGGHRAPVTAIKWCPAYHLRDFATSSHLRLASGDCDGGVVVWDVLSASQIARLEDVPAAKDVLRDYLARPSSSADRDRDSSRTPGDTDGITSLAWVMPESNVLAVVVAPALLLLWDVTSGSILWKRELSSGAQLFGQLAVAPLDSRQVCLCGSSGALVVLQLTDPSRDKVVVQQYRVNSQAPEGSSKPSASSLQALFPTSPGLLVLLLPRELLLFDLELGSPASSSPLPSNMAAFSHLLGVFGAGVCQGLGDEGGLDFAYCAHVDGTLSVWVRVPGALKFKLGSSSRLAPAPIRGANSQVSLAIVKACLWRDHHADQRHTTSAQTAASTGKITAQLNRSLAAMHLTRDAQASSTAGSRRAGGAASGGAGGAGGSAIVQSARSLVMAVTGDGRLWQWQVALPCYPRRSFLTNSDEQPITAINSSIQAARAAAAPATVVPQLVGLLHGLPGSITAISLQPRPLLLPGHIAKLTSSISSTAASSSAASSRRSSQQQPKLQNTALDDPFGELAAEASVQQQQQGVLAPASEDIAVSDSAGAAAAEAGSEPVPPAECIVFGAAATATGHIEVFCVRRGHVNPLAVEVASSHAVHKDAVRGVRWLGSSSVLVSFSSEKSSSGGWRNSCLLTDVRTGKSLPFRDGSGSENSPLLGIRVSPSGAYLLLVFKSGPAELWTTLLTATTAAAAGSSQPTSRAASRLSLASLAAGPAVADAAAGPVAGGAGCLAKPWRMRLLDLPFSAVEWLAAQEDLQTGVFSTWAWDTGLQTAVAAAASDFTAAEDESAPEQSFSRRVSSGVSRTLAAPSMSVAVNTDSFPTELLAFALVDGRSGVLSVRGRRVSDMRPKRPSSTPGPGETAGTSLAGVWPLLVQGDADGNLLSWDLVTGRCSNLATGFGLVRRMQLAPPAPPALSGAWDASGGSPRMRAAVLFSSGAFGVYELDAAGRMQATAANPSATAKFGRVLDINWVALPGTAGGGSILSVVLEDGSLSLLDVSQCQAKRPKAKARQALLHQVLNTPSPAQLAAGLPFVANIPVLLVQPRPLGSSMMLQQPWVLLLRSLLQLGISQNALLYVSSSSTDEDEDVRQELQQLLPLTARATLADIAAASRLQASSAQQQATGSSSDVGSAAGAGQATGSSSPAVSKTKSSPLLKGAFGSPNKLGAALQGSSSARVLDGLGESGAASSKRQGDSLPAQLAGLTNSERFNGDLVKLLRRISKLRGSGQLLHADEWKAYSEALKSGCVARRMCVAAQLSGHQEEVRFWSALPATLQLGVKAMHTAIRAAQQQQQQQQQQGPQGSTNVAAGPASDPVPAAASAVAAPGQVAVGVPTSPSRSSSQVEAELEHQESLDEYDRMVQQALEKKEALETKQVLDSSSASGTGTTDQPVSAAAVPGSTSQAHLSRRGSGARVPGHVRVSSGPMEQQFSQHGVIKMAAAGRPVLLWDEELVLSDAQERLLWHEALPGQLFEAEGALELRLLEYVVLGDFATAVAYLLSTTPESSVRYYRSVVCALALAATASLRAQSARSVQPAAMLHLQAAKVVSAHAASIGDTLLGVPLNCSAGLNADAVQLLQEAGMWQFAASLVARALTGTERAQALSRWAGHVLQQEGSVWRCAGILTSAGCLAAAVQVLRGAGLPACAHAYVLACQQAGLLVEPAALLQQPSQQQPPEPGGISVAAVNTPGAAQAPSASSLGGVDRLEDEQASQVQLQLFDLLGQRSRMMPWTGRVSAAEREALSGPQELKAIDSEFHRYLCALLSSL